MSPTHDPGATDAGAGRPAVPAAAPLGRGDVDDVYPAVYEALGRVAHRHLRRERTGHTLGTTALVHEVYLELVRLEHVRWPRRAYVLAAASQAMLRVFIGYALARRAQKRGGGAMVVESLDGTVAMAVSCGGELLALDEALGISAARVKRDWTLARTSLNGGVGE
jgi:hypothetical protein